MSDEPKGLYASKVEQKNERWTVNVKLFAKKVETFHWQLAELYQYAYSSLEEQPDLLPAAFKELGIASEELQVAVEELKQKNEELNSARASLEAERQRYEDLFEFAPDGYIVTDPEGKIIEANRAAAQMLNVLQTALAGKLLTVFIPPEERKDFRSQLNRLYHDNQAIWGEIRLQQRNGDILEAAMRVATIRTPNQPVVLLWLLRDITEQKQAQREQNDSESSKDRPVYVYTKGEVISLKPHLIWQICKGLVKLSTLSANGEEVIVGLLGSQMHFGLSSTSLQTYEAKALSDVHLICFSESEIANSRCLAQTLLTQMNQRLQHTESLLAIFGQRRVLDRLNCLLQLLKQQIGEPVEEGMRLTVRLTHEDLANTCCTTRVTITRLLSKLQQQGKITFDSKQHIILKETRFHNSKR